MKRINYKYINNENKPVILFLHGFLGSMEDWVGIREPLQKEYSFLLIDLPWHGSSGGAENMRDAAEQIIELLNLLELNKIYLYGYSLGGRLGLYLTLKYSSYFHKVVLESASPGLKSEEERRERIRHDEDLARRLESEPLQSFLSFWYNQPLFSGLIKHDKFSEIYKRRLKNDPKRLAQSLRRLGTGKQPPLWDELRSCPLPLCLIAGESDAKFTGINAEMCRLNSLFTCKIVKHSGHTVYVENQLAVIKIIQDFFKE